MTFFIAAAPFAIAKVALSPKVAADNDRHTAIEKFGTTVTRCIDNWFLVHQTHSVHSPFMAKK